MSSKPPAGRVDRVGRLENDIALEVDLDQAAGGHLLEQEAIGVDQKVVVRPGHARGDVREDEIVPAVHCDQAIARSQVDAGLPFLRRNTLLDGLGLSCGFHASLRAADGGITGPTEKYTSAATAAVAAETIFGAGRLFQNDLQPFAGPEHPRGARNKLLSLMQFVS